MQQVYDFTMDPEGACVKVVRAGLVCHAHNSTHNTLAAPASLLPRAARTA